MTTPAPQPRADDGVSNRRAADDDHAPGPLADARGTDDAFLTASVSERAPPEGTVAGKHAERGPAERVRRGIILDRDGTLIDFHRDAELGAVVSAFHPSQLRLLPGVIEGLRMLHEAGFVLAMATNQPGAAKGQIPEAAIHRTNRALVDLLADRGIPIAAVATCLHHPEGGPGGDPALAQPCACRKPLPGMLLDLARDLRLDPAASWMIGDGAVDVEAARRAGMRAGLVIDTRRCELCPIKDEADRCDRVAPDRSAARLDVLAAAILAAPPLA
ncbi:MAG: HAD-IIIA family hydrolase [Minicystis sp.]